ncbi:MAG: hypothetical protein GY812_07515 [Actinomycetia bacterium]|nr:hypothetical protein [Actinomycetes bacterium]
MAIRTDLEAAMAVLPQGADRDLVRAALDPSVRGFSRLEFLGDAVLGLAVFASGEAAGRKRPTLLKAVSNDALRALKDKSFDQLTSAPTGDVIETLIGAIHLSCGFTFAARWAVQQCLPDVSPVTGGDEASREAAALIDRSGLTFIGAAVMSAVVADHLCTTEPRRSQRWYSETRHSLLERQRVAALLATSQGDERPGEHDWKRLVDRFERAAARSYLDSGWDCRTAVLSALHVNAA